MDNALEIRLIGELAILRSGRALALPASKKTRALIGYLVATGCRHLRERLCDLLWEGPDDPRAELRWSLTKLRPLLNDGGIERLRADRDHVAFEAGEVFIDLARARELLAAGVERTSPDALREAARLLHGEFLDGLDLLTCPRYYDWCGAEREAVSSLRLSVLRELVSRVAGGAEEALGYARLLVAADPLSETGHAAVVRLLGAAGRTRDALAHYQYSRRLLEGELAAPTSGELDEARRALRRDTPEPIGMSYPSPMSNAYASPAGAPQAPPSSARGDTPGPKSERGRSALPPLIGRQFERARIDAQLARAASGNVSALTLLRGEAGIGKSRLLDYACERAQAAGGLTLAARAFEAELARPYGVWVDTLRCIAPTDSPPELRQDLSVLLPEFGPRTGETGDRLRLFESVVRLLSHTSRRHRFVALIFDDLQWADDASCALIHYATRAFAGASNLAILCAVRPAEQENSTQATNLLQSLRRERRLEEIEVGPLSPAETGELVRTVAPNVDGQAVFSESEGNPFFTIELAQARAHGIDWAERSLGSLIAAQLARLDTRSRDVLTYAAALGRSFTLELLGPACGFDAPSLYAALSELERRGLIRTAGGERYDFAHDLMRQAAYRGLSQPRRRLLHTQIARSLAVAVEADESLYTELARHASTAGEHELAAHACVEAGRRCLRAVANVEAATLVELGLRHVKRLPQGTRRLRLHIGLLGIKMWVHAGPGARRPSPESVDELAELVAEAKRAGLYAEAAQGYEMLALHWFGSGDAAHAQESTLASASASRAADEATRARQFAATARCLLDLERDIDRACELLREAALAAQPLGLAVVDYEYGQGLLHRFLGDDAAAISELESALEMARQAQDRWRECRCLTYLMMFAFEHGEAARVDGHAAALLAVGAEMGEADVPFARVLRTLARLGEHPDSAWRDLGESIEALRQVSDNSHLAYALNHAATRWLDLGRPGAAREFCSEALAAAEAVHRASEALIARAIMARCALAAGQRTAASTQIRDLCAAVGGPTPVSARARAAVEQAAQLAGIRIPTPAPTQSQVS